MEPDELLKGSIRRATLDVPTPELSVGALSLRRLTLADNRLLQKYGDEGQNAAAFMALCLSNGNGARLFPDGRLDEAVAWIESLPIDVVERIGRAAKEMNGLTGGDDEKNSPATP